MFKSFCDAEEKVSPQTYDTDVHDRLCKTGNECKNVVKIAKGLKGNLSRLSGFKLSQKIQILQKGSGEVQYICKRCFYGEFDTDQCLWSFLVTGL